MLPHESTTPSRRSFSRPALILSVVTAALLAVLAVAAVSGAAAPAAPVRPNRPGAVPGSHAPATTTVQLDPTFGGDGIVTTVISVGLDLGDGMTIQPDGKIILAGSSERGVPGSYRFALARYLPDGSLDLTFGLNGVSLTPTLSSNDVLRDVDRQDDGKLVAVGSTNAASPQAAAVVMRYLPGGALDLSWGLDGVVTVPFNSGASNLKDEAFTVRVQDDGKVLVGGYSDREPFLFNFALARLLPDGDLDNSFGVSGVVTTVVGGFYSRILDLEVQDDDKIVAVGEASGVQSSEFAAVRYHPDGSLDNSFGSGGIVTIPIGQIASAVAVHVQPDGKIVLGGNSYKLTPPFNYSFALARTLPDGMPDATFGTGGATTRTMTSEGAFASGMAAQSDGRFILLGTRLDAGAAVLGRWDDDGVPDNTFGPGGVLESVLAAGVDMRDILLQSDGKIVVAGAAVNAPVYTEGEFLLARYTIDESPPGDYGIQMSGDQSDVGAPGETISYTVQISNTGNLSDTFALSLSGNSWAAVLSDDSIVLGPGATGAVVVAVQVPSDATTPGASDTVTVTAVSAGDPNISASSDLTTEAAGLRIYLPLILKP